MDIFRLWDLEGSDRLLFQPKNEALRPRVPPCGRRYRGRGPNAAEFAFARSAVERFRRVDVDEDRVVVHLDLGDQLGVFADQVPGADIAGDPGHLGEEAAGPQYRVAALAMPGRHDDGAALERVEGGDQPVDMPAGDERHVAEADERRRRDRPAAPRCRASARSIARRQSRGCAPARPEACRARRRSRRRGCRGRR